MHMQDTVSLIINGDDFGASPAVNDALVRCHRDGVLTSATVLANQPAAEEALAAGRAYPALGIGVHLNLTEGVPLSPPAAIRSLVDQGGRFRAFPAQLLRIINGQARIAEVEREFRAQIEYLVARGVSPTHVDGHFHVHAFPRLLGLVLRLMSEYEIRGMRSPVLTAWTPLYLEARLAARGARVDAARGGPTRGGTWWGTSTRAAWTSVGSGLSRRGRKVAHLARRQVVTADCLLDSATFLGCADPVGALGTALSGVRSGTIELMTHPGFVDDAARGTAEVTLLTSPHLRAMFEAHGIRRVHYGELPDCR
jgi:predicted glycoside hydrolase/deacetylase ChbG (UPF0249 family)